MTGQIARKYEFPVIRILLCSIQRYVDHSVFSRERETIESCRDSKALYAITGDVPLNNKNIQTILAHVHTNLVGMCKEALPLE